jgi:DNA repair protein RadD
MSLRPRQIQAVDDVSAAYRAGYKAPVLIAPTGFGKTHISATIIRRALAKNKRVWFLAHLKEILQATSAKLSTEGIPHAWIAAGNLSDRRQAVQVCMVQTLVRRLDRYAPPDLLIVDEAHLAVANTYQQIFEWAKAGPKHWQPGGAHLLHLTATPQRLDGRGLAEIADVLIPTCSTQDLIDEGLLAPIRYYAPKSEDLSGIKSRGGDFAQDELARIMDKPKITGSAVAEYRKVAHGRPAVAFCVSIEHAQHVAEEFRAAGYRAVAISGESDPTERDAALTGPAGGRLDVVCNCALWVAGVDAPAVACIIMLAPTQSLTKYLQSIGRGLRTHPGKDCCVVLDHAGNLGRHGPPAAVREWTLEATEKKKGAKKSETPVKSCPSCFAVVHSAATDCGCGHHFVTEGRKLEEVEGELQAVDLTAARVEQRREQGRAQTEADLVALGRARGMKRPELWARHVVRARMAKEQRAT